MNNELILYTAFGAAAVIMAVYHLRSRRKLISVLTGGVSGIAVLFLLEKLSDCLCINVELNAFNTANSFIFGVPYVVIITIMNFL